MQWRILSKGDRYNGNVHTWRKTHLPKERCHLSWDSTPFNTKSKPFKSKQKYLKIFSNSIRNLWLNNTLHQLYSEAHVLIPKIYSIPKNIREISKSKLMAAFIYWWPCAYRGCIFIDFQALSQFIILPYM